MGGGGCLGDKSQQILENFPLLWLFFRCRFYTPFDLIGLDLVIKKVRINDQMKICQPMQDLLFQIICFEENAVAQLIVDDCVAFEVAAWLTFNLYSLCK